LFLKAFFPDQFPLPWSNEHLVLLDVLQHVILTGGCVAVGMPRGYGKTTIAECAAIWALAYGHRGFVCIVGPDDDHAIQRLATIKRQIEDNDRLFRAFPEMCYPVRRLEGIAQRRLLYEGKRIFLRWEGGTLVLPNIPGAESAGGIVSTCGITGQIRGQKFDVTVVEPNGRRRIITRRPDFAIPDDPQTRESAKNPNTTKERVKLIEGDVLGLAGPDRRMACVMPCTVIYPSDLADQFLDHSKKPEWDGIRTKMLKSWPTNKKGWKEYREVRHAGMQAGDRGAAGDAYYRAHQAELDEGAEVSWKHRLEGCVSAIQNAMNKWIDNPESFFAEYQNDPRPELGSQSQLEETQVIERINGFDRGLAPASAQYVTCFIDLQIDAFYWLVCGWDQRFTGWVLDYGTFPDQERSLFFYGDLPRPLRQEPGFEGLGLEEMLFLALQNLTAQLLVRDWIRQDGAPLRIDRCLIDANWGLSRDTVYRFIGQSAFKQILAPSHGMYVGAKSTPFVARGKKERDLIGTNWRMPAVERRGEVRHVVFDANFWKSTILSRLLVAPGSGSGLSLFGDDPQRHSLLALHWTSEKFNDIPFGGRSVREWTPPRPQQPDNHWWDCIVGNGVAASMCGANILGIPDRAPRPLSVQRPAVNLVPPPGHGSFFVTDR
jgi:hypothetical protein